MLAGRPSGEVEIPAAVAPLVGAARVRPVWRNLLGGVTFEVGEGEHRRFLKWAPASTGIDLLDEAERMRWLAPFSRVPEVLDAGRSLAAEAGTWLVTGPLPGASAVDRRWKEAPELAVLAIGEGLRHLHDHAPVEPCPYLWSIESRLEQARERVAAGLTGPAAWHIEHQHLSPTAALAILEDPPPPSGDGQLVVCHGDACAPNTIVGVDGSWVGHVDLGSIGVSDRWADLAVATWSTEWNFGPGWEDALLQGYGIAPDPTRQRYYRLLWDLT